MNDDERGEELASNGLEFNLGDFYITDNGLLSGYANVKEDIKSTIYKYLNSESDYNANGFAEKAGLSDDEPAGIEFREVNEAYSVRNLITEDVEAPEIISVFCQFSSKYWLLDSSELGLLCNRTIDASNVDIFISDILVNILKTYGINNKDGNDVGECAIWWLRDPECENGGNRALAVSHEGKLYSKSYTDTIGIRAAFQVQI